MSKLIIAIKLILLVTIMSFSATTFAAQKVSVGVEPVSKGVPGLERIKADMSGHFLNMEDGLPAFRGFNSYAPVHDAFVTSSVREGDRLTLNVRVSWREENSGKRTMANGRLTYQKTDGAWKLMDVQRNDLGEVGRFSQVNGGDDC